MSTLNYGSRYGGYGGITGVGGPYGPTGIGRRDHLEHDWDSDWLPDVDA